MTLSQWMVGRGMKDAELASIVGVDRSYLGRIKNGKRQPSLRVAKRLSEITGLPIDAFATGAA